MCQVKVTRVQKLPKAQKKTSISARARLTATIVQRISFCILPLGLVCQVAAATALREEDTPMIRAQGLSEEKFHAIVEAHGRLALSDFLELNRPDNETQARLGKLVERAQTNWLAGTVESARETFKEIVQLTLTADWRESQREAIHYAMLRLAQSAQNPLERESWLEKAATSFPDLNIDRNVFPPPLAAAYGDVRKRVVALAINFAPFEHFSDYRYILINGKKHQNSPDLKILLPKSTFRVTALSDVFPPVSEQLTATQLQVFRLSVPALASGNCSSPGGADSLRDIEKVTVVYSADCLRTRTNTGWLTRSYDQAANLRPPMMSDLGLNPSDPFQKPAPAERATINKNTLLWIGLGVIAAGAAVWFHNDYVNE